VRIAKARWRVELDCRVLQEELGLDDYEAAHGGDGAIAPAW
jgi:hypothetical protein